jgi:hypothetical protein
MSARIVVLIVSFCLALSGVVVGNVFLTAMIGEINRKRHDGDTVSYFGFQVAKTLQILHEYRTSYPGGALHIYWWIACMAMFIGCIGCVISLGVLR